MVLVTGTSRISRTHRRTRVSRTHRRTRISRTYEGTRITRIPRMETYGDTAHCRAALYTFMVTIAPGYIG